MIVNYKILKKLIDYIYESIDKRYYNSFEIEDEIITNSNRLDPLY